MREGHPMLWSLSDPRDDELLVVEFPYFETAGGTAFHQTKTYVPHEGELSSPDIIVWNHGLAQILTALADARLRLTAIEEHCSVPWNPLGPAMERLANGEYQLRQRPERLAASYTLQAVKG